MKPSDHPDFYRRPPPEGRSRESTLRLDARGRFWHEGRLVSHAGLAAALHTWIRRHPDDGRFILSNGYDWTYFAVDDAPFFVRSLRAEPEAEPERVVLGLSDGTEETFDPTTARIGSDDALYARVKDAAPGGPYEAKFTPHAQTSLEPLLVPPVPSEGADGTDQRAGLRIGSRVVGIGPSNS